MINVEENHTYQVKAHLSHNKLRHIVLTDGTINEFLRRVSDVNVQRIEYVPFMRFYLSNQLLEITGQGFEEILKEIVHDRDIGGFTIGLQNETNEIDDYIKFSTAISHLIGLPNFDAMSGKYYARFSVKHSDNSDTFLRKAYQTVRLHTDGTFVNEPTDWLLMMKFKEDNVTGGETRLLHLDDLEEIDQLANHPFASHQFKFSYADRKSKNIDDEVYHSIFYYLNNRPCIRYNHQPLQPVNTSQAMYLKKIQDTIESSSGTTQIKLPEGDLVVLNNHFWLHGREAFKENTNLYRELLRQRGRFLDI